MIGVDVTPMYVGGTWREASDGASYSVVNPATGETIGSAPCATTSDVDDALTAAQAGFLEWRETDPWERCRILRAVGSLIHARCDEIARTLTEEQGKPLRESQAELKGTWEQFDWFADEARRISAVVVPTSDPRHSAMVLREPIGPVAAFSPWNFPALLPSRKIAPALAAGCSVILKPAEETPRTALAIAAACHDAGLPAGALTVITGDPVRISEQLLTSPVIRKLTVTGSVPGGRHLLHLAADNIVDATLELGGHAPVVVLPDVDPAGAGRTCAAAKFRNAGQVCISPTRFYIHQTCYQEFCDAFVQTAAALRVGDGMAPTTDVGPLTTARRVAALQDLVNDAVAHGATLAHGATPIPDAGFFFAPTVLTDVPESARAMCEEPFGPVALLAPYSHAGDVVQRANATPFGLAAYVQSGDVTSGQRMARQLEAGMVGVNHFALSYAGVPFGPVKGSGIGTESGPGALDSFLVYKAIHTAPSPFDRNGAADWESTQ